MVVNLLHVIQKEKVSFEADKIFWNWGKKIVFKSKKPIKRFSREALRPSLLRAFGFQVIQPKHPFLLRKQLRVRSLPLTTYKERGGNCLIDVIYVKMQKRQFTIFFYTALLP